MPGPVRSHALFIFAILLGVAWFWHLPGTSLRGTTAFSKPPLPATAASSDNQDFSKVKGVGIVNEVIGDYTLPKPVVISPHNAQRLWQDLGVDVRETSNRDQYIVAPQDPSNYRAFNQVEKAYLRDMTGGEVNPSHNPGIRIEPNFVSEDLETRIMDELYSMAKEYGYDFSASDDGVVPAKSWRLTGSAVDANPRAPWGWGTEFDRTKVPQGLREVVDKISTLPGYPLGPIRDITVNIRSSDDYQMVPHIDPLPDGPNVFILSLMSGAVATFSPIKAMRDEPVRANDDEEYMLHSYTDEDIDCLVPRRAVYHFSGNARYLWTHAVRPALVQMGEQGQESYERFGTWDSVLRRQKHRAAIILNFADPPVEELPSQA